MKRIKTPFEFEIVPDTIKIGVHWISVHLTNIGTKKLNHLDFKLHSDNPFLISVLGTGKYVGEMDVGETEIFPIQVSADVSTRLYATVSGFEGEGDYFFWTSPRLRLDVGIPTARLKYVFALTHPHVALNDSIEAEAVVEGVAGGEDYRVTFWHDAPSSFEKIADVNIEKLSPGEVKRLSIDFTPKEKGVHEIYVYLYDDSKYIGSEKETIYVS